MGGKGLYVFVVTVRGGLCVHRCHVVGLPSPASRGHCGMVYWMIITCRGRLSSHACFQAKKDVVYEGGQLTLDGTKFNAAETLTTYKTSSGVDKGKHYSLLAVYMCLVHADKAAGVYRTLCTKEKIPGVRFSPLRRGVVHTCLPGHHSGQTRPEQLFEWYQGNVCQYCQVSVPRVKPCVVVNSYTRQTAAARNWTDRLLQTMAVPVPRSWMIKRQVRTMPGIRYWPAVHIKSFLTCPVFQCWPGPCNIDRRQRKYNRRGTGPVQMAQGFIH
jgi:hypothetical protein